MKTFFISTLLILVLGTVGSAQESEGPKLCNEDKFPMSIAVNQAKPSIPHDELSKKWNENYKESYSTFGTYVGRNDILIQINCNGEVVSFKMTGLHNMNFNFQKEIHEELKTMKWIPGDMGEGRDKVDMQIHWMMIVSKDGIKFNPY